MKVLFEQDDAHIAFLTYSANPQEVEQVISLFEEIAVEQFWQPEDELRAYLESSKYFVLTVNGCLAGALQLVTANSDERFPCLKVWPELDLQGRTDVVDIALLALRPKFRGQRKLYWLLCAETWRYCMYQGISEMWIEATPAKVEIYRRLGWPLQIEGPLRAQWEEYCHPCKMSVEAFAESMKARAQKSETYKRIVEQMYR